MPEEESIQFRLRDRASIGEPAHAALLAGLRHEARAVGLSEDEIARAEERGRTSPHTTVAQALRRAIRRKAYGSPRSKPDRWMVRECALAAEVGVRDLQSQPCHIGGGICSGGCNNPAHYCDCPMFSVERVSEVEQEADGGR